MFYLFEILKLEKSYVDSYGVFKVGEVVFVNVIYVFNGLDSVNNVIYVVIVVDDEKIIVDVLIKWIEGMKIVVISKEIIFMILIVDEIVVIDVMSVVLVVGKYIFLIDVWSEGYFYIYVEIMDNVFIDFKYVKLIEDFENLVDWNVLGVYYVIVLFDLVSGYIVKDVKVSVVVVDVGSLKVIFVNMKLYNLIIVFVVVEDDINGVGVYKINWVIKDVNGFII